MRTYLIGPMTGYPEYNRAMFEAAAAWCRRQGWTPVSPHDTDPTHPGDCPPGEKHKGHPNACWYAAGVRTLLGCDQGALLPGWEPSTGSNIEVAVANITHRPLIPYRPDGIT